MKQIERIERMERILNEAEQAVRALRTALDGYEALQARVDELEAYYIGGVWLRDYEDDEAGRLPPDIKCGVLSQDAVYDLLRMRDDLEAQIQAHAQRRESKQNPG